MGETVVVALGGNAILQPRQRGTYGEQLHNVAVAARQVAALVTAGFRVVVTHGNGPQVGNVLIQNERAADVVPPMPLDVCGAQTQGFIGYMLQQCLENELAGACPVATLVTQVLVDPADPAFADPSKPIGPFWTADEAQRLMAERGYRMKEDAGRGWRRVVPSPEPVEIVEREAIRALLAAGVLVVAGGGGGVPVIRRIGNLVGIDAVIDKDLAGMRLATEVQADRFVILTDVPQVMIHYRQPGEQALDTITCSEAEAYLAQGHFAAGSMGPKVRAAVRFVRSGGREAMITALATLEAAVAGEAGTRIVPDPVPAAKR